MNPLSSMIEQYFAKSVYFRLGLNWTNTDALMNDHLNLSFHTNAGRTRFVACGVLKEKPRVLKTAFFNGCSFETRSIKEAILFPSNRGYSVASDLCTSCREEKVDSTKLLYMLSIDEQLAEKN